MIPIRVEVLIEHLMLRINHSNLVRSEWSYGQRQSISNEGGGSQMALLDTFAQTRTPTKINKAS